MLLCWEREAGELCVLDLYSFEHDAIGLGSGVRADTPAVDRPEGALVSITFSHVHMEHACVDQQDAPLPPTHLVPRQGSPMCP